MKQQKWIQPAAMLLLALTPMACTGAFEVIDQSDDASVELSVKEISPGVCLYNTTASRRVKVVDTKNGKKRARVSIPGLPDPSKVVRATLRYQAKRVERARGEGKIHVNGTWTQPIPTDAASKNRRKRFELDITGHTRVGKNTITFRGEEIRRGVSFEISHVALIVEGPSLNCGQPKQPAPTPSSLLANETPMGISAFGALSKDFPRKKTLRVLSALERPMTTVLLDFGPVYDRDNIQMFLPGRRGQRSPNAAHFAALADFMRDYIAKTPNAKARHLQLFLLNGPGFRRGGNYSRAFSMTPGQLNQAVISNADTRHDLKRYLTQLAGTVAPFEAQLNLRLAVGLEDNYSVQGARALQNLAKTSGWRWSIGRNPCACGSGDTARVGDFHESHKHGQRAISALPGNLMRGDVFSNDGWGWTVAEHGGGFVDGDDVVKMVQRAKRTRLRFHLWYDPSQGYPIPSQGPRLLRFDHSPEQIIGWFARGLGQTRSSASTGRGKEITQGFKEARYTNRHNWVLNCRDYAYSARGDEHQACDGDFRPDGTTGGKAIFTFKNVIADRYKVQIEGRHTENRNPNKMVVTVNGVSKRINQVSDRGYVFDTHGTYDLQGTVTVIIDSTQSRGSDAVRRVRLSPVR